MRKIPISGVGMYSVVKPWPQDCYVQGGDDGIVFTEEGAFDAVMSSSVEALEVVCGKTSRAHYTTAFFEAFPKHPSTFIRGEGKTVDEAEACAWTQYEKFASCPNHEFERRGYRNGAGFCKHCGMFASKAFEPLDHCCICDQPTHHIQDRHQRWYCERHKGAMKPEDETDLMKRMRALFPQMHGSS